MGFMQGFHNNGRDVVIKRGVRWRPLLLLRAISSNSSLIFSIGATSSHEVQVTIVVNRSDAHLQRRRQVCPCLPM
jgi:hypothetical protein